MPASTVCVICKRVVYVDDVDASGKCCFCEAPKSAPSRLARVTKLEQRDDD